MDDQEHSEGVSPRGRRRLWVASALVSLACLIIISGIWVRVYTAPPARDPRQTVVTTSEEVERYLEAHVPVPDDASGAPIFVPTGLYIESLQFQGPHDVQLSGYVWQRYADGLPEDLIQGFVMPEAERTRITEVYRAQQGDEELIGWSFEATLREQFDYRKYPLDRQVIWIQLWHSDFQKNVYVTPDLSAYTSLDPTTLPGLDTDVVLEDWDIQDSFFSFRTRTYNADFGIEWYDPSRKEPELSYGIDIRRHLLDTLISRMVTPLVILIQLFVIVMVIGTDSKRLEQFGVRPGGVIFTCAAFFFAILVAQNALRDAVQAYGFVYLESWHILTYFVILGVGINSVLLVARPNLGLFRKNDNMWVEVLYWPMVLLTMVVVTVWIFR